MTRRSMLGRSTRSGAVRGTSIRRTAALLLLLGLVASACGDDSGDSTTTPSPTSAPSAVTTTAAPSTFVKGCTEGKSWVDPSELSPSRTVARCEPNTPEPKPLATRSKIIVTTAGPNLEHVAGIRLAISKGEFNKENLDVDLRTLGSGDAYPLMAKGDVDAVWSGPEAAFHNQIVTGTNFRWITGNYFPAPESKTGLWANKACSSWGGKTPDLQSLKGKAIGSLVGGGSVVIYPIGEAVKKAGGSLRDVQLKQLPGGADFIKALRDCAVDAAWVLDPTWVELTKDANMVFLQGQPPSEPIGGLMFGPSVLEKDRAKGLAFVRAYIRTINTYLPLNYHSNEAFMDELSTLLSTPKANLLATPSQQYDWEIRKDSSLRMQQYYVEAGSQQGAIMNEDKTTDRSFYEIVVGKRAA